ncbi:hypothetical protein WJX81_008374 [Elliptochloris bilobata]|uniref:Chlorophyll a-b binding protein, chloroplastic n=1 Tax=Elliptochloris bilobata TaxID=381761 RepID=A0AAW1QXT5_9CHLO
MHFDRHKVGICPAAKISLRMAGGMALLDAGKATFCGKAAALGRGNGIKTSALFKQFQGAAKKAQNTGTKQLKKAAPAKQAKKAVAAPIKRAVPKTNPQGTKTRTAGYRKYQGEDLWLPNTTRPPWLDGSLPGDRGFDPLGLAKPAEYLQVGSDELDQNAAVNKAGAIIGQFQKATGTKVSDTALQPYDEVFGLERFRETELIHGRWAMLATLGVVVAEATTGVSWVDAGKVELDGASYLGFSLPFSISQLVWIEALLVGGAEVYRNRELDTETRIYPGGYFDPLGLASGDDERAFKLKTAELKHGRLAMIAFLGYGVQALTTGEGALGSLAKFTNNFAPELVEAAEEAVGAI